MARKPRNTASTTGARPAKAEVVEGVEGGVEGFFAKAVAEERTERNRKREMNVMSCHRRVLSDRVLPAGIHSTKDALDDGNAYDSALRAAAATINATRGVRQPPPRLA
jgi:hypothetical protein